MKNAIKKAEIIIPKNKGVNVFFNDYSRRLLIVFILYFENLSLNEIFLKIKKDNIEELMEKFKTSSNKKIQKLLKPILSLSKNTFNDVYNALGISIIDYENNIKRERKKYNLNTPVGKIPFDEKDNEFYNKLSDKEVLKLYLEERELKDFVNPKTFEVLVERNLLLRAETKQDLLKKSYKL